MKILSDKESRQAVIISECGMYCARHEGDCLKISLPAKTSNDWTGSSEFIDLPYMDKTSFYSMLEALELFKQNFFGDK